MTYKYNTGGDMLRKSCPKLEQYIAVEFEATSDVLPTNVYKINVY